MNTLLYFLVGTWFVSYTNFPMWTEGHKTNPTFTYTLVKKKDGSAILFDEVNYLQRGKIHAIKGFDHPDKNDHNAFIWRGKGLLSPLKSRWKLVLQDEAGQWAVICFSKTLFTPKGVDVISKTSLLSDAQIKDIKARMQADSLLRDYVKTLKQLKSSGNESY